MRIMVFMKFGLINLHEYFISCLYDLTRMTIKKIWECAESFSNFVLKRR